MGEQLDPKDKSKPFGASLWSLIESVQEFEHKDFVEQLYGLAYEDFLTKEENDKLLEWAEGDMFETSAEVMELLRKCPHQYATAVWLELKLRDLPEADT